MAALAGLVPLLAVMAGVGGTRAAGPKEAPPVSVGDPVWQPGPVGSWATVTVRLRQVAPGRPFTGELWLVPEDVVVAPPVTSSTVTTSALSRASTTTTTRPPPSPTEAVYKAPITFGAGDGSVTVSLLVPVGTVSYRPEVHDGAGRLVVSGGSTKPVGSRAVGIGLLTDRRDGLPVLQARLAGAAQIVTTFQAGAGFPEDPAALAGLDVIVVDDFDSKALNPRQTQALEDYVVTGGTVLVAGGEAGSKTAAGLPDALVPLRPTGVTPASLAPMFDLVGDGTALTVPVVTGEVRDGRTVLAGPGGPPLIVEADHGWGRVVELSFDLLAMSDAVRLLPAAAQTSRFLMTVPFGVGLLRAAHTPPGPLAVGRTVMLTAPPEPDPRLPVWSYLGGQAGRRASDVPVLEVLVLPLVLYLLAGAVVWVSVRGRNGPVRFWAGVPLVAVVVAVLVGGVPYLRHREPLDDDAVRFDRVGGERALSEEYHHLSAVRGGKVGLSVPAAGVWMGTAPAGPTRLPEDLAGVAGQGPKPGPGSIETAGPIEVKVDAVARDDGRRLRVLRGRTAGVALEAHLSLSGAKLVGTVTNLGPEPLSKLAAHLPGGMRADLASGVAAGATVTVEGPLGATSATPAGDRQSQALDQVLEGWAAEMGPGRVTLSAFAPAGGNDLGAHVRQGSSIRLVAFPADIETADSFDAGFGAPRLVARTAGNVYSAGGVAVYDLRLPVGMTAAVSLSVPTLIRQLLGPGRLAPPAGTIPQTDAYDWQTGTWRALSNQGASRPLTPGEVAGGVVRVRVSPFNETVPVGELVATEKAAP